MMSLLFIGGAKGAWQVRGRQLAPMLGARATGRPQPSDWSSGGLIVLVKRAPEQWYREAQSTTALLVWDVLDFWYQPVANATPEADLVTQIAEIRRGLRIAEVIGATKAMARAIGGVYLPHHSRPGLVPTPPRKVYRRVAYEGSGRYLMEWGPILQRICDRRGLEFIINPEDLGSADLIVALRGGVWDSQLCRNWKSGVKLVNALAAGRPILSQCSAAFFEIQPAGLVVETEADLEDAIEWYRPVARRQQAYAVGLQRAQEYTITAVAKRYRTLLETVWSRRR